MVKFWPKISIFEPICQTLEVKIHLKLGLLGPKTMPKYFINNSRTTLKKSRKWLFRPPKWSKLRSQNGQILTKNLDFQGQLSTFWAENTPKNGPFKSKNNALTNPEQLLNNFPKVQKTTFLPPKMVKTRVPTLAKKVDFWVYFGPKTSNIASKVLKPILKSFPLHARHLTTLEIGKK